MAMVSKSDHNTSISQPWKTTSGLKCAPEILDLVAKMAPAPAIGVKGVEVQQ
ncbi:hypothetical protein BGX31_004673, partial [Mortierella sp. GBA43]